ncbi:hypothetical protein Q8A73_007404 [Channa argus]|nr:hypothetical protein Q8A73_007404 [Channa argus]
MLTNDVLRHRRQDFLALRCAPTPEARFNTRGGREARLVFALLRAHGVCAREAAVHSFVPDSSSSIHVFLLPFVADPNAPVLLSANYSLLARLRAPSVTFNSAGGAQQHQSHFRFIIEPVAVNLIRVSTERKPTKIQPDTLGICVVVVVVVVVVADADLPPSKRAPSAVCFPFDSRIASSAISCLPCSAVEKRE